MTLKAGEELAGRYLVKEEIGAGGMGMVLAAEDTKLGREVAIKVLLASRVGDDEARLRLIREARASAKLDHPGIVQVFDVGETEDGDAYLVMEMIRGKSVRQLLREGPVSPAIAVGIINEAAQALGSAHEKGLVHRDVKPENLMVREDGRVVVLDFGLVKSMGGGATANTPNRATLQQLTKSGAIVGTPAYLSPEQVQGDIGPATDQWALAVVAYELLAGRLPWDGADVTAMLIQIVMEELPVASTVSDASPDTDEALGRALAKKPEDRYPDITSFADALAGTDSSGHSFERIAAIAAILIVLVALAGLGWKMYGGAAETDPSGGSEPAAVEAS